MNFKEQWNLQANLIREEAHKRLNMKQYLVKYKADYADEFDVYSLAVLTQEDKDYFDNLPEDVFPLTKYIGSNQEIEYKNKTNLLRDYTWTEITKEEAELITKLIGKEYGHFYYPEFDLDYKDDDRYEDYDLSAILI